MVEGLQINLIQKLVKKGSTYIIYKNIVDQLLSRLPERYADVATFAPTFLYESLWNLGVFAVLMLLVIPRLWDRARAGTIFAAYLMLYSVGRLWWESMRTDPATIIAGERVNTWLFGIVLVLSAAFVIQSLVRLRRAA